MRRSALKFKSPLRVAISRFEIVVIVGVLAVLTLFLIPIVFSNRAFQRRFNPMHNPIKCSSTLRGLGISLVLYSSDHRFFPHMVARDQVNDKTQITRVYETLVYQSYFDNVEGLVCSESNDYLLQVADKVWENPIIINLDVGNKKGADGDPGTKPVHRGSATDILLNPNLSYTYRKRRLNASRATTQSILCADKDLRLPGSPIGYSKPNEKSVGNHEDGFNVLHADGHVSFVPKDSSDQIQQMVKELVFEDSLIAERVANIRAGK